MNIFPELHHPVIMTKPDQYHPLVEKTHSTMSFHSRDSLLCHTMQQWGEGVTYVHESAAADRSLPPSCHLPSWLLLHYIPSLFLCLSPTCHTHQNKVGIYLDFLSSFFLLNMQCLVFYYYFFVREVFEIVTLGKETTNWRRSLHFMRLRTFG